ncbi:putative peptidoglycan binding domain-containing protein [Staphylococcus argenteus]
MGGPQHREFRKEILQAMQVWVGPNTENFEKKFYKQCKFGNQS